MQHRFTTDSILADMVDSDPSLLTTLSRFGLSLGFGEKRVGDICQSEGVDTDTFLLVSNFLSGWDVDCNAVSVAALLKYLKASHVYFLDYALPNIRRQLIEAVDCSRDEDVAMLIIRYFDKYIAAVRRHMNYEDQVVFKYVDGLLGGSRQADYAISMFATRHKSIQDTLQELKRIIIRYYIPPQKVNQLNSVLYTIIRTGRDLEGHCRVEDRLLVPAVEKLETGCKVLVQGEDCGEAAEEGTAQELTSRETDILRSLALGMSNKEIADRICVSVHTVATHRRNIAAKLNIHSAAGLTIYAVINGIIDPKAVKL